MGGFVDDGERRRWCECCLVGETARPVALDRDDRMAARGREAVTLEAARPGVRPEGRAATRLAVRGRAARLAQPCGLGLHSRCAFVRPWGRAAVRSRADSRSWVAARPRKNGLHLPWETRFEICLGIARGLAYLHEESSVRIVHRDVKASNILLDDNLNPKISDFGLAKLYDDKKTHISTRVAGTIGYLAPEYAMRGHLTEKADVFGFGVVALEVLSGRPNSDSDLDDEKVYLLDWAWSLHEQKHEQELVDPSLSSLYNEDEALRLLGVSLLCIQASPALRPPMSRVVAMLAGDIEVSEVTLRPSYLTEWDMKGISENFVSDDFSGSTDTRFTNSQVSSSSNPNTVVDVGSKSPTSTPLKHDFLGEGR
ncbi:putative LRR receptor-like serine/threonine-protein kinase [Platanthera zijinensis]|uniref:LRR receptor-like serine/threonine-protein kinase n=1 Tax=Platanthera zijinensis TaxID=2320716 RepID=A0AAP0FX48_9ASPA